MYRALISLALASLVFLLAVPYSIAATCSTIAERLRTVWLQGEGTIPPLAKIEKSLGMGYITPIAAQRYYWDDFSMTIENGITIQIQGNFPSELTNTPAPHLTDALAQLGTPTRQTTRTLTWHTWFCTDTDSSISYLVDPRQQVIAFSGRTCKGKNFSRCTLFFANPDP